MLACAYLAILGARHIVLSNVDHMGNDIRLTKLIRSALVMDLYSRSPVSPRYYLGIKMLGRFGNSLLQSEQGV